MLIDEGHRLVRACLALNRPGPYQVQAAINAVHTDALDASMTDWSQVLALYDQLMALGPNPVVALNRAVAVAEIDGPEVALALVDQLDLAGYHAWQATRADLLRRLKRYAEARIAYDHAIELAGNEAERAFLRGRRDGLHRDLVLHRLGDRDAHREVLVGRRDRLGVGHRPRAASTRCSASVRRPSHGRGARRARRVDQRVEPRRARRCARRPCTSSNRFHSIGASS